MSNELELEVFRVGDYGEKGGYTQEDIDHIVADYDPRVHEAPVTLDHSQTGPAFGWVQGLRRVGDVLVAKLKDLSDPFIMLLKEGAYKKRSIELYRLFKTTGRPYLRAVSFLGAMAPEVKGLADPVFEDTGDFDEIDFAAEDVESVDLPEFQETPTQEPDVIEEAEKLGTFEEMEQQVARLSSEKEVIATQLEKERAEQRRGELHSFVEELKREGKVLPAWEEHGLVRFMESLDREASVTFGEDNSRTPLEWFREFLQSLPAIVRFDEVAAESSGATSEKYRLPQSSSHAVVSSTSIDLHQKVIRFLEVNPDITYSEAIRKVAAAG